MALKLDILANTRQFVSEMKKSGASVEDISDALTDMTRDGEKSFDKMESGFRDMVRDAKKADTAVEQVGGNGFKRASEGASEFKSEALQNFSEVTSSFDGSMSSVADLAQGTFGGLASSIPGVGIALGVVAAGIGLVAGDIQAQAEAAAELKTALADAYKTAAEEGRNYLTEAQIISAATEILFDPEKKKKAADDAKAIGVDLMTFVRAMSGDEDAVATAIEAGNAKYRERSDLIEKHAGQDAAVVKATDGQLTQLGHINGALETQLENHKANKDAVRDVQNLEKNLSDEQRTQIQRTRDADQARWTAYAAASKAALDKTAAAGATLRQNLSAPITTTMHVNVDRRAVDDLQRRLNAGFSVVVRPGQVAWN